MKIRFGNITLDHIFASVSYLREENLSGFLSTNSKSCLAQLYSLSKSITKSIKHLKQEVESMKAEGGS